MVLKFTWSYNRGGLYKYTTTMFQQKGLPEVNHDRKGYHERGQRQGIAHVIHETERVYLFLQAQRDNYMEVQHV